MTTAGEVKKAFYDVLKCFECEEDALEDSNYCEGHRPYPHSYVMRTGKRCRADRNKPKGFWVGLIAGLGIAIVIVMLVVVAGCTNESNTPYPHQTPLPCNSDCWT